MPEFGVNIERVKTSQSRKMNLINEKLVKLIVVEVEEWLQSEQK